MRVTLHAALAEVVDALISKNLPEEVVTLYFESPLAHHTGELTPGEATTPSIFTRKFKSTHGGATGKGTPF